MFRNHLMKSRPVIMAETWLCMLKLAEMTDRISVVRTARRSIQAGLLQVRPHKNTIPSWEASRNSTLT